MSPHVLLLGDKAFTTGRTVFKDHAPAEPDKSPRIWVPIRFQAQGSGIITHAALDTGSRWCIAGAEWAEATGMELGGEPQTLRTTYGTIQARSGRMAISIVPTEGDALALEATFLVDETEQWPPHLLLLGYQGFLERIRIAIDAMNNQLYFGADPSAPSAA